MKPSIDFLVHKKDLKQARFVPGPSEEAIFLTDDEILLKIDQFAFTSNNVTYAAFGNAMNYWQFFPVAVTDEAWGRIPVWGFANIVRLGSTFVGNGAVAPGALQLGERIYGYFPMSSHLVVKPSTVNPQGFSDGAAHRAKLHSVYNHYQRCAAVATYRADREAQQMLVQPLFMTSYFIDDFLADHDFFGAAQVVLSSASSKTAFSTAHQLKLRQANSVASLAGSPAASTVKAPKIVGLTSQSNALFVNALGCYNQVLTYAEISQLDPTIKTVFVDMAGNADIRRQIHEHFKDALSYSCSVGGTHWDALSVPGQGSSIPGPKPTLFFAPAQIKKRSEQWGTKELQTRMGKAWLAFLPQLDDWMHVVQHPGEAAVLKVYQEFLAGRSHADQGHVLSLRSAEQRCNSETSPTT